MRDGDLILLGAFLVLLLACALVRVGRRRGTAYLMATRAIRVDREVKAALDRERREDERNYNAAILRIVARANKRG